MRLIKDIVKAILPASWWKIGVDKYYAKGKYARYFFSYFPSLIPLLKKKQSYKMAWDVMQEAFHLRNLKLFERCKVYLENDFIRIRIRASQIFFDDDVTDKAFAEITQKVYDYRQHQNQEKIVNLKCETPSEIGSTLVVAHLGYAFASEKTLFPVLKAFFKGVDLSRFKHILIANTPVPNEFSEWYKSKNIDLLETEVGQDYKLFCDVIIDWDGLASEVNLTFPKEQRPYIISLGNDFIPLNERDGFFTPETAAENLLPELREKALPIADRAWLNLFDKTLPVQDAPPPYVKNGYLTFATVSEVFKCTDMTLKLWTDMMAEIPTSRIVFYNPAYKGRHYKKWILREMGDRGVAPDRISFCTDSGFPEYCKNFNNYDFFLGAYPWPGGRTTSHLLASGFFPLILAKKDFTYTQLLKGYFLALNVPELVLETPEEYISFAKSLSESPHKIVELRGRIRENFKEIMDNSDYFTHCFEEKIIEFMDNKRSPVEVNDMFESDKCA